jgi:hypothetical protein
MNQLKDSRLLRISSKDRSQESKSKYNIVFNTNDNDLHQIKRITLKSAVIPNTQYNINKYNNVLYLPNTRTEQTLFEITPGQYTTNEFITTLTTVVNAALGGSSLAIVQNSITNKLTLTLSGGTMDIFNKSMNSMATVLGIDNNALEVAEYECDGLPNLSGLNHIYLSSQTLSGNAQMISHDKQKQNIFSDITVKVCFGQTQYTDEDSNSLDYCVFHSHKNISSIDLRLMDEHNNDLDLNGSDWTLVFRVYK